VWHDSRSASVTTSISNPGHSLILEALFLKPLLWASKEKKVRRENKNRLPMMVINSMVLCFRCDRCCCLKGFRFDGTT